jgi:hypothetical protein
MYDSYPPAERLLRFIQIERWKSHFSCLYPASIERVVPPFPDKKKYMHIYYMFLLDDVCSLLHCAQNVL